MVVAVVVAVVPEPLFVVGIAGAEADAAQRFALCTPEFSNQLRVFSSICICICQEKWAKICMCCIN